MIRKLQRKFIIIAMSSLTVVMLLVVGSVNIINFHQMDQKLNGILQMLSMNQGKFPKFEKDRPPERKRPYDFQFNEETPYETRYFLIEVDPEGNVLEIDTSHIAAVSSKEAKEYAMQILSEEKGSGYLGAYKYAVVEEDYGSLIIILDGRNELQIMSRYLLISCLVALASLLLVFLLVSILSKRAIKPIIESMEKQKQFITDAGHEIKTPLAIISANTDVLELTSGESEWITSTRNQITRLDKLVKNLLVLSKLEEGNLDLVFTEVDLSKEVLVIAEPFKAMAEMQNKSFLLDIEPGLKVQGDQSSIHQLVSTLMDNAMKYSIQGGTIRLSLASLKKGVKLQVYNTVDQIEVEKLDKLFDRFYRADSSRSRETGGYGIGLSIAKSIVEAHQGKISASSVDGKSICFTVLL